ncbi:MAG: hypothetical protein M0Q51_10105 [Bacteroidales bacterium]|nr:hypothetical protein [Bacteroidales bacterium]
MQHQVGKARYSISVFIILVTIAWIYTWLRAIFIPFQSDEAATFFMYIQPGKLFPPFSTIDANNHILNSIFTWVSFKIFGSSPLALRLPNVLTTLVYFFFIFKLSRLLNWNFAKWGFILLSAGTHFLLEFFSYSRGYGLSIALMTGALYELINLIKETRLKPVILAVLYSILATAANLNLIFISLSIHIFILALLLFKLKSLQKKTVITSILFVFLAGGLSSLYFIFYSFQVREAAGFYYGSSAGFFKVTVESLAAMISGRFKIIIESLAVFSFAIVVFGTLVVLITKKERHYLPKGHAIFPALLLISWIGSLLLYYFWNVNFQEDRAAMHLVPLFYAMVFFALDSLPAAFRRYTLIAVIPFVFILVYSIEQVSLKKSVYGNSQQVPPAFFQYIKDDASRKPFPPVVSSYQARRQGWAFMNYRSGGLLNPLTWKAFPNPSADFLIHEFPLPDSIRGLFEPILTDQSTQTALYRKIAGPDFISFQTLTLENPIHGQGEYYNLFEISSDSIKGKSLRLETELTLESPKKTLQAAVVVEVFDENRNTLAYEAIDLDHLHPVWDQHNHLFRHVMIIHDIPQESKTILIYLWNKEKVRIAIYEGYTIFKITN